MNRDQRINTVALLLQPLMVFLSDHLGQQLELGEGNAPEITLIVGVENVVQYASNMPREEQKKNLRELLQRWEIDVPSTSAGEVEAGDTRAFEFLLNAFEQASQHPDPTSQSYAQRRAELLSYVGALVAQAKRTTS